MYVSFCPIAFVPSPADAETVSGTVYAGTEKLGNGKGGQARMALTEGGERKNLGG
jgi:hypothetical protein